jgi:hypothetical protein
MQTPTESQQPKDNKIILTDAPLADQRENGTEEKPLHKYFVALCFTRAIKTPEGADAMELRLSGIEVDSEDGGGAEWLGKRLTENDSQLPSGFLFNCAISKKLD